MRTFLIYISILAIIGTIIYFRWPRATPHSISKTIKSEGLTVKIKPFNNKSGHYLKIAGLFADTDSLSEFVFYSAPFNMGPLGVRPMKKLSSGSNRFTRSEDFYYCLSPADSLYNLSESFAMDRRDLLILYHADSLLKRNKTYSAIYHNHFQNFLLYTRLHLSFTDQGLFRAIEQE